MDWRTEVRWLKEAGYEMRWPTWPTTWIMAHGNGEVRLIDVPLCEFPESGVVDDCDGDA